MERTWPMTSFAAFTNFLGQIFYSFCWFFPQMDDRQIAVTRHILLGYWDFALLSANTVATYKRRQVDIKWWALWKSMSPLLQRTFGRQFLNLLPTVWWPKPNGCCGLPSDSAPLITRQRGGKICRKVHIFHCCCNCHQNQAISSHVRTKCC